MHSPAAARAALRRRPIERALGLTALLTLWALPAAAAALVLAATATVWLVGRPARRLALFTWLLPFHVLLITVLFALVGLPAPLVRAIAAWKEVTVLLLLCAAIARAALGAGPRATVSWLDVTVGAAVLLAVGHFLAGIARGGQIGVVPQLYGLRDAAFFLLLYFVGRATPEIGDDDRALGRLFAVGVVTGAIAIAERLFVTPELLVLLGAATYYQDFLGVTGVTLGNEYGLPDYYWSQFGGQMMRRAGSVYLGSMNFALSFLVVIPAATLWLTGRARGAGLRVRIAYAVVWAGLLLSITRMSIAACLVQVVLLVVLLGRPRTLVGVAVAAAALFAAALASVRGLPTFVWETLTWQTGSSESHLQAWRDGLQVAVEHPLGVGFGMGDNAIRFGGRTLSSDNLYLNYAVEQGAIGLLLHLAIWAGVAAHAATVALGGGPSSQRKLGALVLVVTAGVALNGMTTLLYNSQMLSYHFFWLAGTVATLAQRRAAPVPGR